MSQFFKDKRSILTLIAVFAAVVCLLLALTRDAEIPLAFSGNESARTAEDSSAAEGETVGKTAGSAEEPTPSHEPVILAGETIPIDARSLTVEAEKVSAEELQTVMAELPQLSQVTVEGNGYSFPERMALRSTFPEISFIWPVELCGRTFSSADSEISFAGDDSLNELDLREILKSAEDFNDLQAVDLTDCGFESERLHRLDEDLGDTDVIWSFPIYGVTVCSTDEEVILSGRPVKDHGAEVEEKIAWMPHLRRVEMAECEIPNQEMAELNDRHPDVRFVWLVQIKWGGILTDSDHFIPYKESGAKQFPGTIGVDALIYCPDLIALDLGHTSLKDLDFLDIMPHLKYLILADNWLRDIEKVGNLKELTWLELFKTGVDDLSPLVGCTSLTDLNICYISTKGDNLYETLRQIKSLKRLWCCGTQLSNDQLAALQEELPDCEIWSKPGDESTGSTWRYSDSYYEMRDAFHMYYMSATGNTVGRLTEEEQAEIHKKYWGY